MIDEKKLIESLRETNWYAKRVDEFQVSEIDGRIYIELNDLFKYINNQPKINAWILCIDMMPEEPKNISLTAMRHEELTLYATLTIEIGEGYRELYYCGNGQWQDETFKEYEVYAWQPLYDSYREDDSPADYEEKIRTPMAHIMQRFMQRL